MRERLFALTAEQRAQLYDFSSNRVFVRFANLERDDGEVDLLDFDIQRLILIARGMSIRPAFSFGVIPFESVVKTINVERTSVYKKRSATPLVEQPT